jgi:hypothetical protein
MEILRRTLMLWIYSHPSYEPYYVGIWDAELPGRALTSCCLTFEKAAEMDCRFFKICTDAFIQRQDEIRWSGGCTGYY